MLNNLFNTLSEHWHSWKNVLKAISYFQKVLQNSPDTVTRVIVLEDIVVSLLPIHSTHAAKAVLQTCNFPESSFYPNVSVIRVTYSNFLKTLITWQAEASIMHSGGNGEKMPDLCILLISNKSGSGCFCIYIVLC